MNCISLHTMSNIKTNHPVDWEARIPHWRWYQELVATGHLDPELMFLSHEAWCTFNESMKSQNIRCLCSRSPSYSMKYFCMTSSQNMVCSHCMQIHKAFVFLRNCKFPPLFFVKHPLVLFGNHKGLNTISTSTMCYYCFIIRHHVSTSVGHFQAIRNITGVVQNCVT